MGQDTAPFRTWYLQLDVLWLPDLSSRTFAVLAGESEVRLCAVVVVSMRGMNTNGFHKQPMYFHD